MERAIIVKILQCKEKNNLTFKLKNIVLIAMFLLLCILSTNVEAREEVPENVIEAKENVINEIMLKSGEGITLVSKYDYNNGNPRIKLTWNAVEGASKYKVYQSKEGETEKVIATVYGTELILNKTVAGIEDNASPSKPKISVVQTEDKKGNNITITPSVDKGTTYRHRVEEVYDPSTEGGDVLFLLDTSGSHSNYHLKLFMGQNSPIISIADDLINKYGFSVATVVMGKRTKDNMIIGDFTKDMEEVKRQVSNFRERDNHFFSLGLKTAIEMLDSRNSRNKNIILFTDCDSDYDGDFAEERDVEAKKALLTEMRNKGIKLWSIYDKVNSRLYIDQYSEAFRGPVKDDETVDAFNDMFSIIKKDIIQKSNTTVTTVISGIKGYQYAITTNSKHTFSNEKIVPLEEVPTYVSGEEEIAQYLHIRAVDNNGNVSETQTVLLQVPAIITLQSDYEYGENYVPLSWTSNDKRSGYEYRLYRQEEGIDNDYKLIPTSNSYEVVVRNETLEEKYSNPGAYTWTVPTGVSSIKVTVAGAGGGGRTEQEIY